MEHTPAYQIIHTDMSKIYALQENYGLAEAKFKEEIDALDQFQVVTPIVGKFSTGKSSLLNALLGKTGDNQWYLGVKITPETSVPTEICYGQEECAILFKQTGEAQTVEARTIPVREFIGSEYSVKEFKTIRLVLNHDFLREISSVKVVDMPGFDSGIELHNRAIDDYLPHSHAYILTFAATEPLIPDSIVQFLKELKLHDMPVYILVTKSKSVTDSQLKECVEKIRHDATKYLALNDVKIECTNVKGKEIIIEPLRSILREIEANSQRIFAENARRIICNEAGRLAIYLRTAIEKKNLEPSELEAEEEKCRHRLERMKEKISRTQDDFAAQTEKSVGNIKAKVQSSLSSSASILENMLMSGIDIRDKVNMIVREAVMSSMKEDFEPRLRRYVEKMAEVLHLDIAADQAIHLDEAQIMADSAVKATIKKSIPLILAAIGGISGPIGALVGFVLGLLVELGFAKKQENDRRRMAQEKVHNEIIPQVVNKAEETVSRVIREQIDKINKMIEDEAEKNIAAQEKALADIKASREEETAAKNDRLAEMQDDLKWAETLIAE